MKSLIRIFLLVVLGSSCTVDSNDDLINDSQNSEYQLIYLNYTEHLYYVKRHLIDYFIMIALGSEFGSDFQISKKWVEPMKLFIDGHPTQDHYKEIERILEDLNSLFSDGFHISITDSSSDANFFAYVGAMEDYRLKYRIPHDLGEQSAGYFFNEVNEQFEISGGHMFVDTEHTTLREQKHLLREELTQALGLGNDILHYGNSIFYQQWSSVTEYSAYDKETIRLLYHPRMIPGLSENSVRSTLKSILKID